jgi:phage gp36-like protein
MPYCTQSDLEKLIPTEELAQLTTESGSSPDANVVTEAIAMADAEIDAYCGKQYAVPFSPVPDRVKSLSVDMAIYHLYSRRSVAPEIRRIKYEDAIKFLKDLAKGLAVLGESSSPPTGAAGSGAADIESGTRIFSRTLLGDF